MLYKIREDRHFPRRCDGKMSFSAGRVWTFLAALLLMSVDCSVVAAQEADAVTGTPKTAKERQAGKAYDPQRVDDCKVPAELRGDSSRPDDCGEKAKAAVREDEAEGAEESPD